jgi:hypothetical protein
MIGETRRRQLIQMQPRWITMKIQLVGIAIMLIAATVFGGEIKVKDSDPSILQIFAMTPTGTDPDHPERPSFSVDSKPLLTIRSIRNLIFAADGKGVAIVLNERDAKKYAEITRKFQGGLLSYQISEGMDPYVANVEKVYPIENGIIKLGEPYFSGNATEYLRHRFGK